MFEDEVLPEDVVFEIEDEVVPEVRDCLGPDLKEDGGFRDIWLGLGYGLWEVFESWFWSSVRMLLSGLPLILLDLFWSLMFETSLREPFLLLPVIGKRSSKRLLFYSSSVDKG